MAACIERNTWNAAVAACNLQSSVKGLGIWGARRRTAAAGLGILGDINTLAVTPSGTDSACAIAAQPPCAPPSLVSYCGRFPTAATCLPGGKSFCSSYPNDPSCNKQVVTQNLIPTTPTTTTTSKTAGYMKIGLLAAVVVVGGVVVYKATKKKGS